MVSNPGGDEVFRTCPDRPWGPPSLLYSGYRVFLGGKELPGRDADTSPLLVPWSRKSRAIPLLPLWAVRPVQSLSACTRVHFTFFYLQGKYVYKAVLRMVLRALACPSVLCSIYRMIQTERSTFWEVIELVLLEKGGSYELLSNSALFKRWGCVNFNPLKTKRRPLYLKTQSVPRCKHFSSRL